MTERKDVVQLELRALRHKAFKVKAILLRTLQQKWNVKFCPISEHDELRLLTFHVWAVKYKVPLKYVIEKVIGFWRERVKGRSGKKSVLGVRVATLTSHKTEAILRSLLEQDYPNRENEHEWRQRKQLQLLGLDEPRGKAQGLLDPRFPEALLYHYKRRIKRRETLLAKAQAARWRKKRSWRNNPWL